MTNRPTSLDNFIGQNDLVSNLRVTVNAAKKRKGVIDHILLYGVAGVGKTSISQLVAHEMGVNMLSVNAAALSTVQDLLGTIMQAKQGDIVFIDEIHRLSSKVAETLYLSMEDSIVDVTFGDLFPATYRIPLPSFTVVGATTLLARVADPLRARFGNVYQIRYYKTPDLAKILGSESVKMGYDITPEALEVVAARGRGTPRTALKLLRRAVDYGSVMETTITGKVASDALNALKIDGKGLTEQDREYLTVLFERANGGPRGVDAIASMMNEERDTIESVVEPWLLHLGMIERTTAGRVLSLPAYNHMNWEVKLTPQEGY